MKRYKVNICALYLACKDSRTPWYAKAFAAGVVGYALSPIDIIPDFIPVLGLLDDIVLIPFGIVLAIKMIPSQIWKDSKAKAEAVLNQNRPKNWMAGGIIIGIWLVLIALTVIAVVRTLKA